MGNRRDVLRYLKISSHYPFMDSRVCFIIFANDPIPCAEEAAA